MREDLSSTYIHFRRTHLEMFGVLIFKELQTLLLLQLLMLGLFARAADRVVVLGALHAIVRVDALRLGLDSVLAWLASDRDLAARAESVASMAVVRLVVRGGVELKMRWVRGLNRLCEFGLFSWLD